MPGILDALLQTWPGRAAQGILGGFMAPGDAYSGRLPMVDENGRTSMDAIGRAADLAGTVMSGTLAAAPARAAGEAVLGSGPIKAYHGSPHDFDRFDLSKIGTGEGAQAYGHGLYFADKEATARAYRDALSPAHQNTLAGNAMLPQPAQIASKVLYNGGDPTARLKTLFPDMSATTVERMVQLARDNPIAPPGRMYEVNIHADPNKLLDWDKPLSQQPGAVQDLAKSVDLSSFKPGNRTRVLLEKFRTGTEQPEYPALGHHLHNVLEDYGAKPRPEISQYFREQGIPGIKYLDQGSRGAGEGSRNYVMFDDKLIEILRKYGLAGLAPMAAAPYFMPQQPQAQ